MRDPEQPGSELMQEIGALRRKVAELERSAGDFSKMKEVLGIVYDAIDSTVGGIVISDLAGRITYVNPAFLRMFGYAGRSEVLGMDAAALFPSGEIRAFADVREIISSTGSHTEEFCVQRKDGSSFHVEVAASTARDFQGRVVGILASFVDISRRKQIEIERESLIRKLQDAVGNIKTLRGLLPICAACKKIRDDQGYWHQVEEYVHMQTGVDFSHSICPDCARRLYGIEESEA